MFRGLLRRAARTLTRVPMLVASPLVLSAFFLVIYSGQLGQAGRALLPDGTYLAFVLPLVLLTTALSGGMVAGQLLVRDMTSGYHDRLLLTGAGRGRVVAAPLAATGVALTVQAVGMVAIGLVLGLRDVPAAGLGALVLGTAAAGSAFALLAVATAVRSRSDAAVNAVFSVLFSLSFLTSAFAPREELSGWLHHVAAVNPLTYVLEALRDAAGGVAPTGALSAGVLTVALVAALGVAACAAAFRHVETAR
jgi:ABC-2 type transport system permease protein